MNEKHSILYLDDEEQNLISFQALFRRKYNVYTTSSAHEAVEILSKHEIKVIFSDQKMPEVSGVEFFETILPDFPHPVRILLTGYADIEAVIDAINKGQVYRYVPKPWDANDLEICVENALEKYHREQQFLNQSRELELTHAALEQFVFSTSQELQHPVARILNTTEQLRQQSTDTGEPLLQKIRVEALRLKAFSDQIAQFYQNSKATLENTVVDLKSIVEDVIRTIPPDLTSAPWKIFTELSLQEEFVSDAHRIRTALQNIVNNAVKFSKNEQDENNIVISVIQNAHKAIFRISDQGVGIPAENLERLFTMQFNAPHASGHGISLFVTKSVVDKMQGKISVSSTPGQGTLVTFEIPFAR